MKSTLHQELQNRAETYLRNKGYWIVGQEVPMPVGVCDVWGLNHSSSYWNGGNGNFDAMAIEVKVSRGDHRSLSQKYKENSIFRLGNYQYILCPKGLIQPNEVHKDWGLLWWSGKKIVNKKEAPKVEMSAEDKLRVIISFLENAVNLHRPKLLDLEDLNEHNR